MKQPSRLKNNFSRLFHPSACCNGKAVLCDALKSQRKLNAIQKDLARREARLSRAISACLKSNDIQTAEFYLRDYRDLAAAKKLLLQISPRKTIVDKYVFSSALLLESFRICTETEDEGMHFIVGMEVEGLIVGTHILEFPYDHRSIAGAAGNHLATHRICIDTYESGLRIVALVHSHPGSGTYANYPSSIDKRTQDLWNKTTMLIGGIWSRDGYLRWSANHAFSVNIVGPHLRHLGGDLWEMEGNHMEDNTNAIA